ncbi:Putative signal peptide protein [Minicystis rosea]|nr:Putative signal peptide protein [Minicystis rosea]
MPTILPRSRAFALAFALAVSGAALPAHAVDYWTPMTVLTEFFKGVPNVKVAPKTVTLANADAIEIAKKLGTDPAHLKRQWNVYVANADGKRTGFAVLDAEIGLHELIDFGVRFDDKGAVSRVEIMAFREPYGDGIVAPRFRNQFVGKTANDAITAGKDIDIVSGATLSSRSVALGVKRDALVLQAALKYGL